MIFPELFLTKTGYRIILYEITEVYSGLQRHLIPPPTAEKLLPQKKGTGAVEKALKKGLCSKRIKFLTGDGVQKKNNVLQRDEVPRKWVF